MLGNFELAYEEMNRSVNDAKNKEEKALAYVGFMKLSLMKKDQGWFDDLKTHFHHAISITKEMPETYYTMGMAYKIRYEMDASKEMFMKVLQINRALIWEANEELADIEKIEEGQPQSPFGKKIALSDGVTRAEITGLFVEELGLERIHPNAMADKTEPLLPSDIAAHSHKGYIMKILPLQIRGLLTDRRGYFYPDVKTNRTEYAVMISDILESMIKYPSFTHGFRGIRSPFEDVKETAPYFHAVMVCTAGYLVMEPQYGFFNPFGKLKGSDALLVIHRLKRLLQHERQDK